MAEVTVAWATAPACDIALSDAGFALFSGESKVVAMVLNPAAAASTTASFDADIDVSAKEAAGAPHTVRVSVDFEPYGVGGIGCAARASGPDADERQTTPAFLAPVLIAASGLLASWRRRGRIRR
jgi:hypothetical protein